MPTKYKSFQDFYDKASPEWRAGWDMHAKMLNLFLYIEQGSRPKTMMYHKAAENIEKYIFENKALEDYFEDHLLDIDQLDVE